MYQLKPVATDSAKPQIIRPIPITQLHVDDRYQRTLSPSFVKFLVRGFNETLLGVLNVSDRGNGHYYVLDGQHRLEAMKQLGRMTAPCIVHQGMTPAEEGEYFNGINRQRRMPTFYDSFKARLFYGDPQAVAIQAIADEVGIPLSANTPQKNGHSVALTCHSTLADIYEQYGAASLQRVLQFICHTWPQTQDALSQQMIIGVARFLEAYQGLITETEATRKLSLVSPLKLSRDAYAYSGNASNLRSGYALARAMVDQYNYSRSSRRITPDVLIEAKHQAHSLSHQKNGS